MSGPKGWTTETYNKTAYEAGRKDFFRRNTKRNPYKDKTLRDMWEQGWDRSQNKDKTLRDMWEEQGWDRSQKEIEWKEQLKDGF